MIRKNKDDDKNYLISSYMNYLRYSPLFERCESQLFFENIRPQVIDFIEDTNKRFKILCSDDYPDVIMGYIMYSFINDKPVVYFAYTKKQYRKSGVFTILINSLIAKGERFLIAHDLPQQYSAKYNFVYNPFLLCFINSKHVPSSKYVRIGDVIKRSKQ